MWQFDVFGFCFSKAFGIIALKLLAISKDAALLSYISCYFTNYINRFDFVFSVLSGYGLRNDFLI